MNKETSGVGERFPRTTRLLKHADYARVYQEGQRQFSATLTVFFLRRPHAEGPRVGFTVSRMLGGAVERNRIKRRLREAIRRKLAMLTMPLDIVINPKKSALRTDFAHLVDEVGRAFTAIQLRAARQGETSPPEA